MGFNNNISKQHSIEWKCTSPTLIPCVRSWTSVRADYQLQCFKTYACEEACRRQKFLRNDFKIILWDLITIRHVTDNVEKC